MPTQPCRIEMFGGLRAHANGRLVERFRTRKAASLLARLALFPQRSHSREELIDLLWPDMQVDAGRANLRQALFTLRRLLDGDHADVSIILSDNSSLRLRPGSVVTDVAELEAALEHSVDGEAGMDRSLRAMELYRGELLQGLYDEWILPERRRLESLYLKGLHEVVNAHARSGDTVRAIPLALRAIRIDPCSEESRLAAMRLYATSGDTVSIRRQLEELTDALKGQLGELPSDETKRLVEQLIAESRANETERLANLAQGSIAHVYPTTTTRKPLCKQPVAAFSACARLATELAFSPFRETHSRAVCAVSLSPQDGTLSQLRKLRTEARASKSPEQQAAVRRKHAEICLALGEEAWACWYGHDEEKWLERLSEMNDDLRTSLHWMLEHHPGQAVQLSGALTRFWYVRNFQREGYQWLRESLERASCARTVARARALTGCAFLAPAYDARAEAQCNEALAICIERSDKWGEAHALRHLGYLAVTRTDCATAESFYNRALRIFTELRENRGRAVTYLCLSFLPPDTGRRRRTDCRRYASMCLGLFRKLDNPWGISMALHAQGQLETDPAKSKLLIQQALATYPEGNGLSEKEYHERALIAIALGESAVARRYFVREMELAKDRDNRMGVAYAMEALVSQPDIDGELAARLFGALWELERKLDIRQDVRLGPIRQTIVGKLGKDRFDFEFGLGRTIPWEQAVDEAGRAQ